ncbi:uncharacterized protein N7459_007489 [Penicillium hispanicum]|uniref:uncharacterized protein n=1 Tax=Penicillium hispanicum TaxID=1080232 RepID=UPI002540D594|nr:uncharacterized protein N7459_007489 [Penicillium hispanicum]KAJ5578525.1 hypothetical protein N7459_007489 [Penicillium hispanicum]
MPTPTHPDGSEDVNDFLLRIRELGERRDKEDEERTKKLEDEILQGRKERQARRAERARSIAGSPTLNAARLSASSLGQPSIDPPEQLEPTLQTPDPETPTGTTLNRLTEARDAGEKRRGSVQDTDVDSPSRAIPTLPRSRAGTLSWQQRPSSRDFGNRSPGSTSPTRSSHLRNASTASEENQLSRGQIAQSLSSKDPTWLRQTPDRGLNSPAYRKSEERPENKLDFGASHRLPGMSRESTAEPDRVEGAEERSPPPGTASSIGDSNFNNRYSSVSSVSPTTGLASPVTLADTPKLDPPQTEASVDDPLPPSPTQRRMSPERTRSTSPTKGLGGFVQSAMMKRSDSVSKRWSAQIPQGLARGNSFISNRNSVAAPSLTASVSDMTSTTSLHANRETSPFPTTSQRPSSSHSEATVNPPEPPTERPTTPSRPVNDDTMRSESSPTRAPLYGHARSTSSATVDSQNPDGPSSPFTSRTMDPKRWSPTKATWLESALNRPDSPQHRRQPSQQPSWARERQSRGSVDMGRVNNFKEVTPVGLMRTPPPGGHFKKPSISGPPSVLGSPSATRAKGMIPEPSVPAENEASPKDEPVIANPDSVEAKSPSPEPGEPSTEPDKTPEPLVKRKSPPPPLSSKPNFSLPLREPMSPKPKPQSPIIDFRANLRKREVAKDSGRENEPEFKNVFGKLKKTETRNYVAPDELKSNILRGKAALNVTGGPKKTQRVDEFKESLLKQKEAMKASGGSIRRNTVGEQDEPPKPAEAVPEAIAKRKIMSETNSIRRTNFDGQSATSPRDPSSKQTSPEPTPLSPPCAGTEFAKDEPQVFSPVESKPNLADLDAKPSPSSKEDDQDGMQTISPTAEVEKKLFNEGMSSVRGLPSPAVAEAAPAVAAIPSLAAKGKLAGRINPALAGLLSRGAPPAAEARKEPVASTPRESSPSLPSASLTHMTKGRARGPKRRPPKEAANPAVSSDRNTKEVGVISSPEVKTSQPSPEPVVPPEHPSEGSSKQNLVLDTEKVQTARFLSKQLPGINISLQNALNGGLQQRLRNLSPSSTGDSNNLPTSDKENPTHEIELPGNVSPSTRPPVPPKPTASPSPSPSTPITSKPQWTQQARYMSSSPSPLRTSYKENRRETPTTPSQKDVPGVMVADSSPPPTRHASPPVPPKQVDISLDKPSDPHMLSRKMSAPSLVAQAADARKVISGFFKTFPNARDRMDIDAQLMLSSKIDDPKIRTLKRHIWELTGDGKRQELPVNQEYVLYEGDMYLCVHLFEMQGKNNAEVNLWCGDDVPEAALEDAQLFARKVARENSCKLEVIRQGKERVRFIQALGGIIITRRGSGFRSTSSSLYMLCGRKHLGQMAFDEVDYSLRSLCTGFPFVISAPFGKQYLWKGKGSGPEETGAARLISMDLGLTGEFEEVDEGQEPEEFFEILTGSREANPLMSSDFWQLKAKYNHFGTRLLRVDHELGQPQRFWMRRPGSSSPVVRPNDTVQEIEPFCYKDLTDRNVYVLDTFFEIYVIVGEQASPKSAEFASAVVFAHEYGILAASLQDRPFIPNSFVALGGIPDRCQSAFRKWDPRSIHAPCVFPLDVAIEAIRS